MTDLTTRALWWRTVDGYLVGLCDSALLHSGRGRSSSGWYVAVLRPRSIDPDRLSVDDWELTYLKRMRTVQDAQARLSKVVDERGGGARIDGGPRLRPPEGDTPWFVRLARWVWRRLANRHER